MKIRKLIVISPLGLALLAALILAWWFLGDDAWIKGKIEDTVSEMTGRSLSIDGDFAPDWSTSPVLTAEKIHFSNPRENGRFQPESKTQSGLSFSVVLFRVRPQAAEVFTLTPSILHAGVSGPWFA